MKVLTLLAGVCLMLLATIATAAELTEGMKKGKPDLQSVGALTFAPQGILLVGDSKGAAVFAIATDDKSAGSPAGALSVEKLDEKIAALLGTTPKSILIHDMAVNPETGSTFLSVSRDPGPQAKPVIVRVDSTGKLAELALDDVLFSKAELPAAPTNDRARQDMTTDLQFTGGQVIVAGMSNEEFGSQLRVLAFPFKKVDGGASVEIYHGAHGKFETKSPVRTFAVFDVAGEPNVLAAYQCTPLVRFPLSDLKPGSKVKGTTIAELGNRNRPLDMIVYQKDGKDYLLLANSSRGVMKVGTDKIDKTAGITERIDGTAGVAYDTVAELKGVMQLDKLDKDHALILVQGEGGGLTLTTVNLP